MHPLYADEAANLARLEAYLQSLYAAAEDPKRAEPFGVEPSKKFPYAAAIAYAHLPDIREPCARVVAWAHCRHKYRASRRPEVKMHMIEKYVEAWGTYVQALLDKHLAMWEDAQPPRLDLFRAMHAFESGRLRDLVCVPTPYLAHDIDVIRNNGMYQSLFLKQAWGAITAYAEPVTAEILAEFKLAKETTTERDRRLKWEARMADPELRAKYGAWAPRK